MKRKVYIVMNYYRQKSIEGVFESKVKAEHYCKCHKGTYILEEVLKDDKKYTLFDFVKVSFKINSKGENIIFAFNALAKEDYKETLKKSHELIESVTATVYINGEIFVKIQKELPKIYSKQEIKEKYIEFLSLNKSKILDINSKYNVKSRGERVLCEKEIEEYFRNNLDLKSEFFN